LIVGGGVFGLWAARHAIKRGERVLLVDKREVGSGASGGFLGALMPHMPDGWDDKKQMQYDALLSLPGAIAELEHDTEIYCGFRRCGRLMPMTHAKMPDNARRRIEGSKKYWGNGQTEEHFTMETVELPFVGTIAAGWLSENVSPYGATFDTLSGRINPRAYLSALNAYVSANCEIRPGVEVISLHPEESHVLLADGSRIDCGRMLIAAGFEAYPLLEQFIGPLNGDRSIGRGVKGQAVLLEYDHGDDLPLVYDDGAFAVPHAGNRVAVGSTSENEWSGDPSRFDEDNMGFYHRAMQLVPALADAPIIGRWAGVRPRNTLGPPWTRTSGTDPFVGPVPGVDGLSVAIGGFKISMGIAHAISDILPASP